MKGLTLSASSIKAHAGHALAIGAFALCTSAASAQTGTGNPPSMDPIAPVVDVNSVTGEVSGFGGDILLAWAGLFIGFGLTYKLVRRLRGTV